MKTTTGFLSRGLIIIILCQMFQTGNLFSQQGWIKTSNSSFGVQLTEILNGSGHGLVTDFSLVFRKGNSEVGAGVFSQCKFKKIGGGSVNYKYFIIPGNSFGMYAHYTFMYHYQNCLNDNWNQQFHPQDYESCSEFEQFNTMSHQIGVGLEFKVLKNLFIDTRFGVGAYLSEITSHDNRNKNILGREDNGISTSVSLGISYKVKARSKKSRFGKY